MEVLGGLAALYLIYFIGVIMLPHLWAAFLLALEFTYTGSITALKWSGVYSVKAWWGCQRLRLGKAGYERRLQARLYMRLILMPRKQREMCGNIWMSPRLERVIVLLRWHLWALHMQVLCLLLHKRLLLYYAWECRRERNRARAQRRKYEQAQREERERREREEAGAKSQEEHSQQDIYALARNILNLPEEFTEKDLTRAYRLAMQWAHPDKGGTHDECLAVQKAREYIKEWHSW